MTDTCRLLLKVAEGIPLAKQIGESIQTKVKGDFFLKYIYIYIYIYIQVKEIRESKWNKSEFFLKKMYIYTRKNMRNVL